MQARLISILVLCLLFSNLGRAQFFNKEISASIKIEKNSEFYTFKAIAENKTPSDYNLRYDFMVFKKDENNNTSKSSQGDRFFLEANQRKILSSVTVNYNVEGNVIIALLIYDQDDNPVGKARLELPDGGKTVFEETRQKPVLSRDQATPGDGFVLQGFVIENTITKAGRDFYRYFFLDYYNREIVTSKNIIIDEVPGRNRFTRVSVSIEGRVVWQFFAQPRKEYLKQMATTALNRSITYLQQLQKQSTQLTKY